MGRKFCIWNHINDNKAIPICSAAKANSIFHNDLNEEGIYALGIINNPELKSFFENDIHDNWENIERVIISKSKLIEIERFIQTNYLVSKKDLIITVIAILNDEASTIINITNDNLINDFENLSKAAMQLKEVVDTFSARYLNEGNPIDERDDLSSITFKFNHPHKTIKITNSFLISFIIHTLKDSYDEELYQSSKYNESFIQFKYKTAQRLHHFFRQTGTQWYCSTDKHAHLKIHEIFELAEIEKDDDKIDDLRSEVIKTWIRKASGRY